MAIPLLATLLPFACATTTAQKAVEVTGPTAISCPTNTSEPPTPTFVEKYDSPPKPIKITRPQYPQEAFIKKIEGVVTVEILIDAKGHVATARVLSTGHPLLDSAAIRTVCEWSFEPAIKDGQPVPTIAHAPVRFAIY